MGVWIEINIYSSKTLPGIVTPYVGVWIEIDKINGEDYGQNVTPYVGVWIEISKSDAIPVTLLSPPMWGCGLKFVKAALHIVKTSHPLCGGVD